MDMLDIIVKSPPARDAGACAAGGQPGRCASDAGDARDFAGHVWAAFLETEGETRTDDDTSVPDCACRADAVDGDERSGPDRDMESCCVDPALVVTIVTDQNVVLDEPCPPAADSSGEDGAPAPDEETAESEPVPPDAMPPDLFGRTGERPTSVSISTDENVAPLKEGVHAEVSPPGEVDTNEPGGPVGVVESPDDAALASPREEHVADMAHEPAVQERHAGTASDGLGDETGGMIDPASAGAGDVPRDIEPDAATEGRLSIAQPERDADIDTGGRQANGMAAMTSATSTFEFAPSHSADVSPTAQPAHAVGDAVPLIAGADRSPGVGSYTLDQLQAGLDRLVLRAAQTDARTLRVELEPASLGRVVFQCRETEGGVSVEMVVRDGHVRALLAGQENDLRQALDAQGLQLDRFAVSCRDDGGNMRDRWGSQGRSTPPSGRQRSMPADAGVTPPVEEVPGAFARGRNRWVA